ncbi:cysteine-rich KTR domain-containing protein [Ruminococcus sp. 5_1_39BFAA]|uniref:cysteine-rich KTR domain-containing protein n=1 Tax=Ruminococcus sp. 5_1_39BFAA TaxID=457412 RepID=UPI003562C84D
MSAIYGTEWIRCPVCGNKTCSRIREDTILINYPLYCPKCKQETLVEVSRFEVTLIKEPDAQTQSR